MESQRKQRIVKGDYDKHPSGRRAMFMLSLFMIMSCFFTMVMAVGLTYGLIGEFDIDVVALVAKLPVYWVISIAMAIMFFVTWLGDALHSK